MKLRAIARSLVALAALVLAMTVALPAQAASATAVFTKTSDWGSGFEGKYPVTNGGTTTINGWSVAFDLPSGANIGSFWDASMSRSGQRFTFTNVGWNGTLAPGAIASFGFNGSPGGSPRPTARSTGRLWRRQHSRVPGSPAVHRTGGTNAVSLSWGASSGTVTGYRVYEGAPWGQVTGTSATIRLWAPALAHLHGRAYNARVRAASDPVSATTTGCTGGAPGRPGTPSATGGAGTCGVGVGRLRRHGDRLPGLRGHDRQGDGHRDGPTVGAGRVRGAHLHGRGVQLGGRGPRERPGQRDHHRLHQPAASCPSTSSPATGRTSTTAPPC